MQPGNLSQLTYWGGWASTVVAVVFKALFSFNVVTHGVLQLGPRHFLELSFLLFLISIASDHLARAKAT